MLSCRLIQKKYLRGLLFILPVLGLAGCRTLTSIATTDLSQSYNEKTAPDGFHCSVFNVNDSISTAVTVFPYNRLGCSKPAKSGQNSRRFRLSFMLYNSFRDQHVLDTASFLFTDSLSVPPPLFSFRHNLKASLGRNYILQVKLTDLNAGTEFMLLQPFLKENRFTASWFGFESASQGLLFTNCLDYNDKVRLIASDASLKSVRVHSFFRNFPPAIPPFSEEPRKPFDYLADSSFSISIENGLSGYFQIPRQGFYLFQADTASANGITLFRNYVGYPKVTTPLRMVETLRYITSAPEFRQLLSSPSQKIAVDSFWVAIAGGPDRAVELIQAYYQRIEEANRLFFSYCEGWKTDRGMIYIAFGPPNVVYRSDFQELWVYGEANNYRSMRFVFEKVLNPFTGNDYILEHQTYYKDYWYNAVQKWRR